MRNALVRCTDYDKSIRYRGKSASRFDNLTDAVFGIAITLLIFNLTNPNSFSDLLLFTKTLPAFLISISFIILIWKEHLRFSEIYGLNDSILSILNTLFVALIIFYVYPLRFLTLFLTNFFFRTDINVSIQGDQVPYLMIYYGFIAFALYFVIYLFYTRAICIRDSLQLTDYEVMYTEEQKKRLKIMFLVPLLSILVTLVTNEFSYILASIFGGLTYFSYMPFIILWHKNFTKKSSELDDV